MSDRDVELKRRRDILDRYRRESGIKAFDEALGEEPPNHESILASVKAREEAESNDQAEYAKLQESLVSEYQERIRISQEVQSSNGEVVHLRRALADSQGITRELLGSLRGNRRMILTRLADALDECGELGKALDEKADRIEELERERNAARTNAREQAQELTKARYESVDQDATIRDLRTQVSELAKLCQIREGEVGISEFEANSLRDTLDAELAFREEYIRQVRGSAKSTHERALKIARKAADAVREQQESREVKEETDD